MIQSPALPRFFLLRPVAPLAASCLAALLVTACGGGGGGGSADAGSGTAATAPVTVAAPADGGASAPVTVTVGVDDGLATASDFAANPGDAAPAAVDALPFDNPMAAADVGTPVTADGLVSALASTAATAPTLVVRARGDLAANVGPIMQVRVDGSTLGSVEVRSTTMADYSFSAPTLKAGSKVDVVFTNDAVINGQDRNLYVGALSSGGTVVLPTIAGSVYDKGNGAAAFDGKDTQAGQAGLYSGGALRLTWPAAAATDAQLAAKYDAARFLMQASFGPTLAEVTRMAGMTPASWINEQMALPFTPDYVNFVQAKYNLGDAWRPGGANFDAGWVAQAFWAGVAKAPDQLRRRTGWALHQIFMASHLDSNLWAHTRAYANYQDTLNKYAFGNYRTLLEEVALSPAMGIYLSHLRNRKEDPATGRVPDENFAREVMQLFSIGLYELNTDGTLKKDANGKPIETYTNADVMALAKVFTGWSWAFPDNQLTESNFRWGSPDLSVAKDTKIDLQRMKAYPGQHSTAEKKLFTGKANALTIPANGSAADDLKLALDALFRHPNVAPFISRQLIQRLVISNPSPAYVGRVAAVFNNNGKGVRGDLAAVVRAILLDAEARVVSTDPGYGKLREPVLRVAQWMRAFGANSSTGEFKMAWELDDVGQRAMYAPSVFGYYRPGYVPPTSAFAATGITAPELQIVNESSTAAWVNLAQSMSADGLGWTGSARDVAANLAPLVTLVNAGNVAALADQLNLLLYAGRMSPELRQALLDAVIGVSNNDSSTALNQARVALFIALAANEYHVQR